MENEKMFHVKQTNITWKLTEKIVREFHHRKFCVG